MIAALSVAAATIRSTGIAVGAASVTSCVMPSVIRSATIEPTNVSVAKLSGGRSVSRVRRASTPGASVPNSLPTSIAVRPWPSKPIRPVAVARVIALAKSTKRFAVGTCCPLVWFVAVRLKPSP